MFGRGLMVAGSLFGLFGLAGVVLPAVGLTLRVVRENNLTRLDLIFMAVFGVALYFSGMKIAARWPPRADLW